MYGIIFILVGAVNLYYGIRFRRDSSFTKNYIKNSSKALLWRKIFGEEKAIKLTKKVLAPIGIVLGTIFVLSGIYMLIK